ncbi:hypothetical protein DFH28DRAFT_967114 [Melampsora americana]|nr:hypothetical protein DFH28DRAFT_967114 [Melampsora americana]
MNPFKLQCQWYHLVMLIILISWSLNARQIASFIIESKESRPLVSCAVEGYDSGRLAPLKTDRRIYEGERALGKLDTIDKHMTNIVEHRYQQPFRIWLKKTHEDQHRVPIHDDGMYAARDFHDQFMAWIRIQHGSISQDRIDEYRWKYPLSGIIPISPESYLRNYILTEDVFIGRYLSQNPPYRRWYSDFIKYRFKDRSIRFAIDYFKEYVEYAMRHVERFKKSTTRNEFFDLYLPDIDGLRWAFWQHLDGLAGLSKAGNRVDNDRLMSTYLQWAAECDVRVFGVPSMDLFWRDNRKLQIARDPLEDKRAYQAYYHRFPISSDLERFFDSGLGNPRMKDAFIRHIHKKAKKSKLTPHQPYLCGDIHWEYRNYCRTNSSFRKNLSRRYRLWKKNMRNGWKDLNYSWRSFDRCDRVFWGVIFRKLGSLIVRFFKF